MSIKNDFYQVNILPKKTNPFSTAIIKMILGRWGVPQNEIVEEESSGKKKILVFVSREKIARDIGGGFKDFFDIGTGTGILALIAHKLGAKKICGIDIEKNAVKTARRNAAINNCRFSFLKSGSFGKISLSRRFDFVAANLLTEDLLSLRDKIIALVRPGKFLAVSGIGEKSYKYFRDNFDSNLLRVIAVRKTGGWRAALYEKR